MILSIAVLPMSQKELTFSYGAQTWQGNRQLEQGHRGDFLPLHTAFCTDLPGLAEGPTPFLKRFAVYCPPSVRLPRLQDRDPQTDFPKPRRLWLARSCGVLSCFESEDVRRAF